jgi:Amt family ammonium transporter
VVCYGAVCLKPLLKYDDSLDAFGIHGVGGFLGALLTGVFASWVLWNAAQGNTQAKEVGTLTAAWPAGMATQLGAQILAAVVAAVYAFGLTFVLVKVIDAVWGFGVKPEAEAAGLDVAEHGETGFDLAGAAQEEVPEMRLPEPRPAMVPPDGKGRFTVVVEGAPVKELLHTWSGLPAARRLRRSSVTSTPT